MPGRDEVGPTMLRLGLGMIQAAGEVRALIGCHLEVADPPARHAANFA